MDEVAEAPAHAALSRVEAAAGFAEVGDGAQLAVDGTAGVPAGVELVAGFLGGFFVFEAGVDVAYEVCRGVEPWLVCFLFMCKWAVEKGGDIRSLLLSHTTSSSSSPYLHSSHQMSS